MLIYSIVKSDYNIVAPITEKLNILINLNGKFCWLVSFILNINDHQIKTCVIDAYGIGKILKSLAKMIDQITGTLENSISTVVTTRDHATHDRISQCDDLRHVLHAISESLVSFIFKLCHDESKKYHQIVIDGIISSKIVDCILSIDSSSLHCHIVPSLLLIRNQRLAITMFQSSIFKNHFYATILNFIHMTPHTTANDILEIGILLNYIWHRYSSGSCEQREFLNNLPQDDIDIDNVLDALVVNRFQLSNIKLESETFDNYWLPNHMDLALPHGSCNTITSYNNMNGVCHCTFAFSNPYLSCQGLKLNNFVSIIYQSLTEFVHLRCNPRFPDSQERLGYYGFVEYKDHPNIGMFSILQFISYMFERDSSHFKPINSSCKRSIRASMVRMAKKLDNEYRFNKCNNQDYKYWKYLILIALGFYSFCYINFNQIKLYDSIVKYLQRFVIPFIEPNLEKLKFNQRNSYLKLSHGILAVCYAFMGDLKNMKNTILMTSVYYMRITTYQS